MEESHLNVQTLRRNPQMAAVGLLANTLDVTAEVLIAAHPQPSWRRMPKEGILAAHVAAILNQIEALEATLSNYKSEVLLPEPPPEPDDFDIPEEIPW